MIDQRISRLLDFVDHEILSSPLNVVEADAVLERIRSQHEADFRTAEASCLEVEDQQRVRVRIRQEQQRQQQQQPSRQTRSPFSFDRIGFDGNPLRTRHRFLGTSTNEYLSSLTSLESESKSESKSKSPSHVSQLAIRSTEPVLDESAVESIRAAAQHVWSSPSETGTSRFTYQYAGNSEAHVFDFVANGESNAVVSNNNDGNDGNNNDGNNNDGNDGNNNDGNNNDGNENSSRSAGARAVAALNEALQEKIYPTIREAFFDSNKNEDDDDTATAATQLFVYDSLVIRYNATAARQAAEAEAGSDGDGDCANANASSRRFSAGQPLHRDLGLVSVNILLTPDSEFEGGGTFFEDQLSSADDDTTRIPEPLKPLGVGHCLAHPASFRHAGAGTTSGVREILVLFVSAVGTGTGTGTGRDPGKNVLQRAPPELRSLRLKECRAFCHECCGDSNNGGELVSQRSVLLCRILHQRLAVRSSSNSDSNSDSNSNNNNKDKNNGNAHLGNDVPLLCSGHDCDCDCDGEAVQYLGTALMEYGDFLLASNSNGASPAASLRALEAARECFELASFLTACDSRVYNNLGIVLGKIRERSRNDDMDNNKALDEAKSAEERAYRTGLALLRRAMEAGCTTAQTDRHLATLSLNYGLFVANQNRFDEAAAILEPVAIGSAIGSGTSPADQAHDATRQNVVRLWEYCKSRCQGTGTAAASR
eukprot:CAMPEP_0172379938 /NCGR_PEP_ID=MMETSP1060-20121228/70184_1 /TAXON_ID=37318 /ORGANISM="Pseudo-nitzschia pungens, Strain cf. cingulata" /LENGTH=707 /DNA_ID=CAMNT_0013107683 /DNA_START=26 /DNA_END=2149 /DNA_ORIENTATION=+